MNRDRFLQHIQHRSDPFDIVVIGGGATGIGVAMEAAVRGLSVLLLEQSDFGKGTSSRSTKLIHGGVRYLKQGNIALVRDSLRERARLMANAPHLVHDLAFLVPCQSLWQRLMYRVGFLLYDFLGGKHSGFGRARGVSPDRSQQLVPTVKPQRLHRGGVVYHDGQFDDARLLIHLAMTAAEHDACLLNYAEVIGLETDDRDRVCGVRFTDRETGERLTATARCVINATGPFCDAVRKMDDAAAEQIIAPSQGVHLVLPRDFMPTDTALIVPKTSDGRVLFLIPWHGHVVVGTTDTAISDTPLEPSAQEDEIEFLLETAAAYLTRPPTRRDILSVFVGIRPLVRGGKSISTKSLSRDHTIEVSPRGMITITGGKWTTVRKMSEDCVDRVIEAAGLTDNGNSTAQLAVHGSLPSEHGRSHLTVYGSDADAIGSIIRQSPDLARQLHVELPIQAAEVIWSVRQEMARTVEDVLARRTRALFLNVQAALAMAPEVARLMAGELDRDEAWQRQQVTAFAQTARHFQVAP
jgi:glycerol-3-phosphate dehydrogenase